MIVIPSIRFRTIAACLLAFAAVAAAHAETTPIRVTAHNVNLRAAPHPTGDLVGQADYNDILLARDLGEALGTGAHLSSLVRTRTGDFRVEEALSLYQALALLAEA